MDKIRNFCTLFNHVFLDRGLVLIESLLRHHEKAQIVVFAFDDLVSEVLSKKADPRIKIVRLSEFEDEELLAVKSERSLGEYCWTATPSTILYCIEKLGMDHCAYLDADLCFFHNTEEFLPEMIRSNKHVMITPHFYTPKFDQSEASGIYCVQYMLFRGTDQGIKILRDWRKDCLEWCFARIEPGRFGDQKYLDYWEERYGEAILVCSDRGMGVAPWNVQQYRRIGDAGWLLRHSQHDSFSMKFYHFHEFKVLKNGKSFRGWYPLPKWARRTLYPFYEQEIMKAREDMKELGVDVKVSTLFDWSCFRPVGLLKKSILQLFLRG